MRRLSSSMWLGPCLTAALASLVPLFVTPSSSHAARVLPEGAIAVGVAGDASAIVLPGSGPPGSALVYFPGRCGDPLAALHAWPTAARRHGSLVVVQGDTPCPKSSRRRWEQPASHTLKRVDAALEAAAPHVSGGLDRASLTLVGYSLGALRAEHVARAAGARAPRVVMVGSPRAANPDNLRASAAMITMVGERDVQQAMRDGTRSLERAGLAVRLFVLPGAGHGEYGPEGERVMNDALDWAFARAPFAPAAR